MTSENVTPAPAPEPTKPTCPECGALRHPGEQTCWVCRGGLQAVAPVAEQHQAPRLRKPESRGDRVSAIVLGALGVLVLVGLVLVQAYGVIILAVIGLVPFLIHHALSSTIAKHPVVDRGADSRQSQGITNTAGSIDQTASGRPISALGALAAVFTIGVAAAAAFFTTCIAAGLGTVVVTDLTSTQGGGTGWMFELGEMVGLAVGGVAALATAGYLTRRLLLRRG